MNKPTSPSLIMRAGSAGVLLFIGASVFSIALLNVAFGIAAAAAAALAAMRGPAVWRAPAPRGSLTTLALFVLAAALSACFSSNPSRSFSGLGGIIVSLAAVLAFAPFVGDRKVSRYGLSVLAVGLLAGLVAMLASDGASVGDSMRLKPFMGIMNYAGSLILIYPVALTLAIKAFRDGDRRTIALLCLILAGIVCGAFLNATRIMWIAMLVVTPLILLLNARDLGRRFLSGFACLIVAVCLFFAVNPDYRHVLVSSVSVTRDPGLETMLETGSTANLTLPQQLAVSKYSSNKVRRVLWEDALSRIPTLPAFGIGLRNVPAMKYNDAYDIVGVEEGSYGHFHNTPLNVLIEMGFPGLLAYIGLWIPSLVLAVRNLFSPSRTRRLWSRILLTVLLAFGIHTMTDTIFNIRSSMFILGLILALCWRRIMTGGEADEAPEDAAA